MTLILLYYQAANLCSTLFQLRNVQQVSCLSRSRTLHTRSLNTDPLAAAVSIMMLTDMLVLDLMAYGAI